jgi:hypothetical protein
MPFEKWMARVNRNVENVIGLSTDDLSDCAYYEWYDCGISSAEAARMALEENGF